MVSLSLLKVLLLIVTACSSLGCDLFMRHVDEYGLGVYAGIYFERNRPIEVAIGVPIPINAIIYTELINYMEGINSTHGVLLLGYSSIFNHVPRQDALIRKHISFHESQIYFPGNIESYDIVTEPIDAVFPGNQVFSYYGDDWFAYRGLDEVVANSMSNSNHIVHAPNLHDISGLIPGCPTQLVTVSTNRLIASRRILKGQIIEVARAMLVPVSEVLVSSGPLSSLVWYSQHYTTSLQSCTSPDFNGTSSCARSAASTTTAAGGSPYHVSPYSSSSDYAVMLLGNGALYGTSSSGSEANVDYSWWTVDMIDPSAVDLDQAILTEPLESYSAGRVADDIQCSTKMLMSFTANRDIDAEEELRVEVEERVIDGLVYKTMNEANSRVCV